MLEIPKKSEPEGIVNSTRMQIEDLPDAPVWGTSRVPDIVFINDEARKVIGTEQLEDGRLVYILDNGEKFFEEIITSASDGAIVKVNVEGVSQEATIDSFNPENRKYSLILNNKEKTTLEADPKEISPLKSSANSGTYGIQASDEGVAA